MALVCLPEGWEGELDDTAPRTPVIPCPAELRVGRYTYACTAEAHPGKYPHLAGDGRHVVAMWWDTEGKH